MYIFNCHGKREDNANLFNKLINKIINLFDKYDY